MTDQVEMLARSTEMPATVLMRVMQQYDYGDNNVILVVEGKDDSSFYERVATERDGGGERRISTIVAGNKSVAIAAYRQLDWPRYDSCRILFFVDRDYSDYLSEDLPQADNFYVTDGYSIENSLITEGTVVALAKRACTGATSLSVADEAHIRRLYSRAVSTVARTLLLIAACNIVWEMEDIPYTADKFRPELFFSGSGGALEVLSGPGNEGLGAIVRCYGAEGHPVDETRVAELMEDMLRKSRYEIVVRGKYRLKMLSFWLKSLKGHVLPSGSKLKVGRIRQDLFAEAMAVAPAPKSLCRFLDVNLSRSIPEMV